MASSTPIETPPAPPAQQRPRKSTNTGSAGDRIFSGLSRGSGILLLVVMAAIAGFLTYRAVNAISQDHGNFLTTFEWLPSQTPPRLRYRRPAWSARSSARSSRWSSRYRSLSASRCSSRTTRPRRLASPLAYIVDLLAAVPSIVYGLWGALVLVPYLDGLNLWLDHYFAWTYIFDQTQSGVARNMLTVGILLAIMILPIVTSVSREVFLQVPRMNEEAALALGATRWEVIRLSVLPFGRSGVISASMLGLGRALGETMAVATVLSPSYLLSLHLLDPGGGTFAQNIAAKFDEANVVGRDALIASGLVLFVLTLLVNGAARLIIARRKEYSGANA